MPSPIELLLSALNRACQELSNDVQKNKIRLKTSPQSFSESPHISCFLEFKLNELSDIHWQVSSPDGRNSEVLIEQERKTTLRDGAGPLWRVVPGGRYSEGEASEGLSPANQTIVKDNWLFPVQSFFLRARPACLLDGQEPEATEIGEPSPVTGPVLVACRGRLFPRHEIVWRSWQAN